MNPFKSGDVVYHPMYGKLVVSKTPERDDDICPCQSSETGVTMFLDYFFLSFKPWGDACHERPFEPKTTPGQMVMILPKYSSFHEIVEETETHVITDTEGGGYLKENYKFFNVGEQIKFD